MFFMVEKAKQELLLENCIGFLKKAKIVQSLFFARGVSSSGYCGDKQWGHAVNLLW